jgi:hypothetical protein
MDPLSIEHVDVPERVLRTFGRVEMTMFSCGFVSLWSFRGWLLLLHRAETLLGLREDRYAGDDDAITLLS